jgi:ribosomal protein L37AE/L43A
MSGHVKPEPCPKCKRNRWRTVVKLLAWRCRWCGYLRDYRPQQAQESAA